MMETGANLVETTIPQPDKNYTQSNFVQKELNFDNIEPNEPLTKATLIDHPQNGIEINIPKSDENHRQTAVPETDENHTETTVPETDENHTETTIPKSDENHQQPTIPQSDENHTQTTILKPDENYKQPTIPQPHENHTQADFIQKELNFDDVDPNDPLTKAALSDHLPNEWMDILGNGQLRKKVLKPGKENSRPNRSDICVIKLIGKLEDGTVVDDEEEITIQLRDMEVIQGIDLAVALMDVEEEAEIEIGPRFAYDALGRKTPLPEIPPNAKLTYNVTLKSSRMEPDIEKLKYSEKRIIGNKKRERGNWWFARDECTLAIHCYRRALEYLSPSRESDVLDEQKSDKVAEPVSDADLQAILEDALKVHNNLAAAQLKCEAYDAALKSVENVLRCQPHNVKALFRKGKIYNCKGEHDKACLVLAQALKIEPENKAIQQELYVSKKKSAKDAQHEKNLYRKMLGTVPDKKQNDSKNNSKRTTALTWSLLGGTFAAVVGIIAYRFVS